MNATPPGWNPDPTGRHEYRYWDGADWTDDVSDNGVTSVDPVGPGGPVGAGGEPAGGEPTAAMDPTQSYDQWTTPPGGPGPTAPGPGAPGHGAPPPYPGGPDPYAASGGYPGQPAKGGSPKGFLIGAAAIAVLGIIALVVVLVSGDDDDSAGDDTTTTTESTDDTTDDTTDTTPTTSSPDPTDADVFSLSVGDCLVDETTGTEVQQVPVVPCDQPHSQEVFYLHEIDADELPGDSEMQSIVGGSCVVEFESFVGVPYEESALDITWLEPTPESWDAGDRELVCMVIDPAGEVTGSLEGANR